MDNSTQQGIHPVNHHTHVYDPQLTHVLDLNNNNNQQQQQQEQQPPPLPPPPPQQQQQQQAGPSISAPATLNTDGTPIKRRPGRPKGSTKKHLLAPDLPPKIKRPVGRPRKDGLPAGTLLKIKREREGIPTQQQPLVYPGGPAPLPGYAPVPYGFPIPGPATAPLPPPAIFQIDHASQINGNDWADLSRSNPNTFLNHLLIALVAPNPVSSAGPTVEEAFKSHLVSLAPNNQQPTQLIPSLYSILKTFWLPSSPAYFSLTASTSTARTPSEHRFLYWDPQPLVFNGIACPSCSFPLMNKGRIGSGPIKVYDTGKPFFVVGCEYLCRSNACIAATTSEGRKFASTDPAILRSLPSKLKDEFPAKLLQGDGEVGSGPNVWNWRALGVSTSLWNLVSGALRAGLKKDVIMALLWAVQNGVPDLSTDPNLQQQPPASTSQSDQHNAQDVNKMDEDEGDEDEDSENKPGTQTTQTLDSTSFSDAYRAAWRENTATSADSPQRPVPTTPASAPPQTAAVPAPTNSMNYSPSYHYPFPYAQLLNNHIVPIPNSTSPGVKNGPEGVPSASTSAVSGPSNSKRSPRHCSKCGSDGCKGKGGRNFCTNSCQDCGKLECKGRNSRRPDKNCTEGWQ